MEEQLRAAIAADLAAPDLAATCGALPLHLLRRGAPADVAAVADRAWEALHAWPWRGVPLAWRRLYAAAQLTAALRLAADGDVAGAITTADRALLLGAPGDGGAAAQGAIATWQTRLLHLQDVEADVEDDAEDDVEDADEKEDAPPANLPRAAVSAVPRVARPSLETFVTRLLGPGAPAVVTGAIEAWPALRRWRRLRYVERVAGPRLVPVEIGARYTDAAWTQRLMTVAEFIARHVRRRRNDDGDSDDAPVGYLAQHELLAQVPALRRDIAVPDYCFCAPDEDDTDDQDGAVHDEDDQGAERAEAADHNHNHDHNDNGPRKRQCREHRRPPEPIINAWFGPRGTVSPLHHDPHDNLLAQVVGAKYVRLYAPAHTPQLHPHADALLHNTSQIDLDSAESRAAFAEVERVPCLETVLRPGEMLFIPRGWWHYVRSLSQSFSVSFWF